MLIPLPILMNKILYKGVFRAIICKKCERGINKERIDSKIEIKASFLFAVLTINTIFRAWYGFSFLNNEHHVIFHSPPIIKLRYDT